jgi:ribosome biogenesis SPOUT family RNA methylase Rps3
MSTMHANNSNTRVPKKETIRELASRHLKDPNHTTTDEEIRNAKVVIDGTDLEDDEMLFETNSTTVPNPYNVVG